MRFWQRPIDFFERLPIKWRLALATSAVTSAILLTFALLIGSFTLQRVEDDFNNDTAARFETLRDQLSFSVKSTSDGRQSLTLRKQLQTILSEPGTTVSIVFDGSSDGSKQTIKSSSSVNLGDPQIGKRVTVGDYSVETRRFLQVPIVDSKGHPYRVPFTNLSGRTTNVPTYKSAVVQIGRSYTQLRRTLARIRLVLALGVTAGSMIALLGGYLLGERAVRPVRRMTSTARAIARTKRLDIKIPETQAKDEISDLGATLQDMLTELASARQRTDDTLRRQREFVADASHELRTPLTSVTANLDYLAEGLKGDQRDAADSALRSARRMNRMVSDLLTLARIDTDSRKPRTTVHLDSIVLETVDELEALLDDHQVQLDLNPVTVAGDHDQFVRIVDNLIGNAVKYTPKGSTISISVDQHEKFGRLVVSDNGPGIPPELRTKIFDRFVRGGGESAGSTGLGLAIVSELVASHDGSVSCTENPAGQTGARFEVLLPVATS